MPIYGSAPYSITQKFQKMTDTKIALQPFLAVIRLHGKELKISNIFSREGVFLPWRGFLLPFPMDRGFVVFHYWAPAYGDRNVRCPLFLGGHHSYLGKEDQKNQGASAIALSRLPSLSPVLSITSWPQRMSFSSPQEDTVRKILSSLSPVKALSTSEK